MEGSTTFHSDILKSLEFLAEIEECAEEVLCDKQELVELDRKENRNRECLRALKKSTDARVWTCFGTAFTKLSVEDAQRIIKEDQEEIKEQKTKTREELKQKVEKLHKLEGLPLLTGFQLKGMTMDELKDIG